MAQAKQTAAGKAVAVLMAVAILFAVCGNVFISASAAGTYGTTVYLKTTDTTTPYIYYWVDGDTSLSASWPGSAMAKMSGETDVYYYDIPCDVSELTGIIFCSDSGGTKMTGDLTSLTGNMYTLSGSTGTWGIYDTSSIKILSYGSDLQSPQYTNSNINLSVNAEGGDGNLQYKISVSGAASAVLSDYSSVNSVVWNPTVEGDYTVLFEVKDGSGETNSRQLDFTIKDSANAVEPVFLGASPANNSEIQKGGVTTVSVDGAGGKLNTNLLFYKTEVIDPDGNTVNTVYYKLGNQVSFTADKLGTYTVKMSIQNSSEKNTTVTNTYTYNSVSELGTDTTTDTTVKVTGVSLNKTSAELKVGDSTALTATVSPSNATDKSVTWTSSNEAVATVSNGTVKAVSAGTATITVTTNDGSFKATCAVTVTADTDTSTDTNTDTDTASDTDTSTESDTDTSTDTSADTSTDTSTDTDTDEPLIGILGDVNGDGEITILDASMAQKQALLLLTLTDEQFKRADVDGDGEITMIDASKIQKAALKLITLE